MLTLLETLDVADPVYLWLLPVTLFLIGWILYLRPASVGTGRGLYAYQSHITYRHPLAHLFHQNTPRQDMSRVRHFNFSMMLFYTVFISLCHLAMAQPFRLGERVPDPPEHRDIVFLVDTSVSMNLRDYQLAGESVNRMRMLKSVLQHFVGELAGSRISLVMFSEQAYTLVPLTTDHELLNVQLQRMLPASLTGRRTIVGNALIYTYASLKEAITEGARPVVVMLTDANAAAGDIDPLVAAQLFARDGVKLHTVAMGAGENTESLSTSQTGLYESVNFNLLEEIAIAGGGEFFLADSHQGLSHALEIIRTTQKREIKSEPLHVIEPLYQWPLGMALVWLLIWQILPILRPGK